MQRFPQLLLRISFSFLLIGCLMPIKAQGLAGARNQDRALMVNLGYGPYSSGGDLANRFGNGWSLDGGVYWLPAKNNLEIGLRMQYGFGAQVKEDVLADLRTREGFLIGNQREPADIQLRQRQLFIGPSLGYTFSIGQNKRAGIHIKTSVGYFFHRIRLQQDPVQGVPQIAEELEPGYDRLTGGPAVHQFVGFQQLALDRRLNFYFGGEVTAGFTKGLRAFDIPTGAAPSADGRTDLLLGLKVGLIIPFYIGEGREIFYK